MNKIICIIILATFYSCSSMTENEKETFVSEKWTGRSSDELTNHPYFEHLKMQKIKHENAPETWFFRDQSHFHSDSYCMSLGGCRGMTVYNCEYAFSVKDKKILGFSQNGVCPGVKNILPVDK